MALEDLGAGGGGAAVADAGAPAGGGMEAPPTGGGEGGTPPGADGAGVGADGAAAGEEELPPASEGDDLPPQEEDEITDGLDTDGRKMDVKTREALASFKKTNPEAATRIGDIYHRAQAIVKDVGATSISDAVNKVRQMTATLSSLGGDEGITELQSKVKDFDTEMQQFRDGDPVLMDQLHTANKEAFAKQLGNGLNILAEKSPDLLDAAMGSALVARLDRSGMYKVVPALMKAIEDGKGDDAYAIAKEMDGWLKGMKSKAEKQIETASKRDPAREQLDKDRADFQRQTQERFEGDIANNVNIKNNESTARVVEPFFKELRLKPEGRREFVNSLNSRIYATMKKDMGFQRAAAAYKGKGDVKATADFVAAKFAELLPSHFRALRNAMYPNYKPAPPRPAGANGAPPPKAAPGAPAKPATPAGAGPQASFTDVAAKPGRDDVDWAKTNDTLWISGRAYLKNGKAVKFDWAKA